MIFFCCNSFSAADDHARVISRVFQIVDDDPFHFRAERGHQMPDQIVRQRTLFRDVAHEHGDRAPDRLIDINDEHFVVVSEKHGAPSAGRQNRAHLHLDHRFVHPRETVSVQLRKHKQAPRREQLCANISRSGLHVRALIEYALCVCRRDRKTPKNEWDVEAAISTYNVDALGQRLFHDQRRGQRRSAAAAGSRRLDRHPRGRQRSARSRPRVFRSSFAFRICCGIASNRSTAPSKPR